MGTLTYTNTLVAGTNENITDVQENFEDISDVLNGNVDSVNLATSSDPVTILGVYRTVSEANVRVTGNTVAGTYQFSMDGTTTTAGSSINDTLTSLIVINSSDWSVSGLTPKLRTTVICDSGFTAPAITFTWGLYPISSVAGGATVITITFGTVVSGSTVAFASPASNTSTVTSSSDYSLPSNGTYMFGCVLSGTSASASRVRFNPRLEIHWV